ncbi:MAG: hypothetical protein CL534_04050 [Ahrensia sp.]|nr:hypothetical protein [Ahrensia sp.]
MSDKANLDVTKKTHIIESATTICARIKEMTGLNASAGTAALLHSFEQALKTPLEGPVRLNEVKVNANTGFKVILYPNASQHVGFSHVQVQLQWSRASLSARAA